MGNKPDPEPVPVIPARLPTCLEWENLLSLVAESPEVIFWEGILSWCRDAATGWSSRRAVRGLAAVRYRHYYAALRLEDVGFRPVFTTLNSGLPDGILDTVGTLYMDGQPVRVPQSDGDIPSYIPGAKLDFRPALEDPNYQVKAITVGDILIADRCLLKCISWPVWTTQNRFFPARIL